MCQFVSSDNKMDAYNLAIVMAPVLMQTDSIENRRISQVIHAMEKNVRLVEKLILFVSDIFETTWLWYKKDYISSSQILLILILDQKMLEWIVFIVTGNRYKKDTLMIRLDGQFHYRHISRWINQLLIFDNCTLVFCGLNVV